jgi:energy-coupling factor transporter ATP-binding protein EcfA2
MTNALDDIAELNPELAEDEQVKNIASDLDKAESIALFANSPAGKETIAKVGREVYAIVNELFENARKPELPVLLSTVLRLEAKLQVYALFQGAQKDADALFNILTETLKSKSGGVGE